MADVLGRGLSATGDDQVEHGTVLHANREASRMLQGDLGAVRRHATAAGASPNPCPLTPPRYPLPVRP